MATVFTYTPTDPTEGHAPTDVFGITFPPGEEVTIQAKDLKSGLTVEKVAEKLRGNPQFTEGKVSKADQVAAAQQ